LNDWIMRRQYWELCRETLPAIEAAITKHGSVTALATYTGMSYSTVDGALKRLRKNGGKRITPKQAARRRVEDRGEISHICGMRT